MRACEHVPYKSRNNWVIGQRVKDFPEKFDDDENIEEGYPVAPLPPDAHEFPEPKIPYRLSKEFLSESSANKPFQFSLADMFALTTAVAVFMSIISMILSGFKNHTIAGASGIGAILSLILLSVWPSEQPLLRLGWWVLFVLYLMTCIGALIFGR
jgi:hypothetical protein